MNDRPDPTPAALYARVSSDRQDVDLSISAQLRALRDYAERNNYAVVREYGDEAESGRVADRPQFRRMLDAAGEAGAPFREILVWKFSRFTRKREHAVAFKSMLRRRGIRVTSITEHADDSPTGKLVEAIIESVDDFYSENLAQPILPIRFSGTAGRAMDSPSITESPVGQSCYPPKRRQAGRGRWWMGLWRGVRKLIDRQWAAEESRRIGEFIASSCDAAAARWVNDEDVPEDDDAVVLMRRIAAAARESARSGTDLRISRTTVDGLRADAASLAARSMSIMSVDFRRRGDGDAARLAAAVGKWLLAASRP